MIESSYHINVVSSVMGSGKTSFAIQEMNANPKRKYIYICPFLNEASRVIDACPDLNFKAPDDTYTTKTRDFQKLIEKNENISSTHKLFEGISSRILDLLRTKNYILVLDESISVLNDYDRDDRQKRQWNSDHEKTVLQGDVDSLIESGYMSLNEHNQLDWIWSRLSAYDKMRDLADRGILYYVNKKALLWSFPDEVFKPDVFSSVVIFSYQFDYQLMSKYLSYFDFDYAMFYVEKDANDKYFLLPYQDGGIHELEFRKFLKSKIHIIQDEKLNAIGNPEGNRITTLSSSWWKRNEKEYMKVLDDNLTTFFRYKTNAPASKRAFTVFKQMKDRVGVHSKYVNSKYWVASNKKATNQYRDRTAVAYCINRYASPDEVEFFRSKKLEIKQDELGLSELLQFLFRFSIREGKDMDVYIPSWRMRTLLELYLDGKEPSEIKNCSRPIKI